MYIPTSSPHLQAARRHGSPAVLHPLTKPFSHISPYPTLIRRQFSDNPTTNNNIKIGLIVGFTLAAFLAIVITFLWVAGGEALPFEFSISCVSFECISASFFDFGK
ncbi:hypothetical protein H9L39_09160 [Fusarium oxysporum f. sp. albedinis]|nr:hypothetical protein H9L39_09160 [Fusarium oxysporum f. sp. albedinis]